MAKTAENRIIDTIEDYRTVDMFMNELCLYIDGKRSELPVIHQTNDASMTGNMEKIAMFCKK